MKLLFWTIGLACASALFAGMLASFFLTGSVPILGSWIRLELTHNPGIAFGVELPAGIQTAAIVGAFIAVFLMAVRGKQSARERVAFGMILGGALANLLDRLPDGLVTDFVAVRGFSVFNLADTWITLGAALLLLDLVKFRGRSLAQFTFHR